MKRTIFFLFFILVFASKVEASSFLTTALRILGVSATPRQQRGSVGSLSGNVFIVDLQNNKCAKITNDGDYRSPIFTPDDKYILVMRKNYLLKFPVIENNKPQILMKIDDVLKLVGFDKEDNNQILLVKKEKKAGPLPAILSLNNSNIKILNYDSKSKEEVKMLNYICGDWERVYGDTVVYTKTELQFQFGRTRSITNIYLRQGELSPFKVSQCAKNDCGQPSLSNNKQMLSYIESE